MTSQQAIEYLESKAVYDELEGCNESAAAYRMAVAALRMTSQPDEQHAYFGITGVRQAMTREEAIARLEGWHHYSFSVEDQEAYRMAIAALREKADEEKKEHDAP